MSPWPALKSVAVSVPGPPLKESAPDPPVSVSLPLSPPFGRRRVVVVAALKGVITTPAEDEVVAVPTPEGVVAVAAVDRVVAEAGVDYATAVAAANQVVTGPGVDGVVAVAAEDHIGAHGGGADVDRLGLVGADDDSDVDRARECTVAHRDGDVREHDGILRHGVDRYRAVGPAAAERDVAEGHHRGVRRGGAQDQAARRRLHVTDEEVHRAG